MDYERYQYSKELNENGQNSTANSTVNSTESRSYYHTANDYNGANGYGTYYTAQGTAKKEEKKKKDAKPFLKKMLAMVAMGAVFGLCAGVAFYMISQLMHFSDEKFGFKEKESEIIEEQDITPIENSSTVAAIDNQTVSTVVTDVTEVVEKVMPSVVSITNEFTEITSFFGQNFENEGQSSGSGIILGENDEELLIVSNYHVVAEADKLMVQFINGKIAEAKVKGTDSNMDLAVIAVGLDDLDSETKNAISIAKMGDSSALKVGEPAIAIGNALGYGQSVTTGVVSALNRQIEMSETGDVSGELIQTDAAINPGNSGGALLNVKGEVIGINSNKIGGGVVEGMGYAIPISSAEPIIQNLMTKETKDKVKQDERGYLGITGINVTADVSEMYGLPKGVCVTQVYDGTAAANAGLIENDIIVGFEGSGVGSMEDLQGYLQYYKKGETVELTIMRATSGVYEEIKRNVTLTGSFSIDN